LARIDYLDLIPQSEIERLRVYASVVMEIYLRSLWNVLTRRKDLGKELRDINESLYLIKAKIRMAWSFKYDRRKRLDFFYRVTIPAALYGIPVTSDTLGSLYINDVWGSLVKLKKKVKGMLKWCSGRPYYTVIKQPLEEFLGIIDECLDALAITDLKRCESLIDKASQVITEALSRIELISIKS